MSKCIIHRNSVHYRMDDRLSDAAKSLLGSIIDGHITRIMDMAAYEELKFYGYIIVSAIVSRERRADDFVFDVYDTATIA